MLQHLISHAVNSGRNEGHPVAMVAMGKSQSGDAVTFGLDMASAPVPQRRYAADVCSVDMRDGDVRFIFAQRGLREGFDSALVVRLNPLAARQFLDTTKAMRGPSTEEIAAKVGATLRPMEAAQEAKQMVGVVANFIAVAVAGWEACLDFYHASAFAMRAVDTKKNQLELEPVVRVDLNTGSFMGMVRGLDQLAEYLPESKYYGESDDGTA